MYLIMLESYNLMLIFFGKIAAYMWADLHYQDTRGRLSGMFLLTLLDKINHFVLY